MKKLSENQLYEVMTIIKQQLTNHSEFLYHEYGFSQRLEGRLEELEANIKKEILSITEQDD